MVTRSKVGIVKANPKYNFHVTTSSPIPSLLFMPFEILTGNKLCVTNTKLSLTITPGHLIETVYMHQPTGFTDSAHSDYVCLLQKSLYGLKQGPDTAYLLLYVDDIILTASSTSLLQRIISLLHAEFSMTDLGPLNCFLGLQLTPRRNLDLNDHRSLILLYIVALPDHFSSLPLPDMICHMQFNSYLFQSTISQLIAYSDADWAGCPATRRSTSRYCVFLGNNILTWSSKRQDTLSRSSAEAEYRGVANAVAETSWIHNLLRELSYPTFHSDLGLL
nr:hypothetical protein [Tanacetum cinerariifolium]